MRRDGFYLAFNISKVKQKFIYDDSKLYYIVQLENKKYIFRVWCLMPEQREGNNHTSVKSVPKQSEKRLESNEIVHFLLTDVAHCKTFVAPYLLYKVRSKINETFSK